MVRETTRSPPGSRTKHVFPVMSWGRGFYTPDLVSRAAREKGFLGKLANCGSARRSDWYELADDSMVRGKWQPVPGSLDDGDADNTEHWCLGACLLATP